MTQKRKTWSPCTRMGTSSCPSCGTRQVSAHRSREVLCRCLYRRFHTPSRMLAMLVLFSNSLLWEFLNKTGQKSIMSPRVSVTCCSATDSQPVSFVFFIRASLPAPCYFEAIYRHLILSSVNIAESQKSEDSFSSFIEVQFTYDNLPIINV